VRVGSFAGLDVSRGSHVELTASDLAEKRATYTDLFRL
jgi:hypothetical protein